MRGVIGFWIVSLHEINDIESIWGDILEERNPTPQGGNEFGINRGRILSFHHYFHAVYEELCN
jgi:hypothetical protein